MGGRVFVLGLFLVIWNKRFFGYDRGFFWVFVLGYWSYGEKKFGSGLVFLVTWNFCFPEVV